MKTNRDRSVDLSAVAPGAKVDRIDEAIDSVAARMTHVTEDAALASRIAEALPERSGWSLGWLMPRLAIMAAIAIGTSLVVLRMLDDGSTSVPRVEQPSAPTVARSSIAERPSIDRRATVAPPAVVRRTIPEVSSSDRTPTTIDVPDFDRSLRALDAASVLTLESLAPVTLPEDAPLTLSPLAIADLPLTAEVISPR
jgi:hypothetical protein